MCQASDTAKGEAVSPEEALQSNDIEDAEEEVSTAVQEIGGIGIIMLIGSPFLAVLDNVAGLMCMGIGAAMLVISYSIFRHEQNARLKRPKVDTATAAD